MIVIVVFLSLEVYLENLHDVLNCLIKNEQTKPLFLSFACFDLISKFRSQIVSDFV